jgi:hypothetical protein
MYDLRQSLQLIKHTFISSLEKDMQIVKIKNLEMTNAKILGHIAKYKFPSSIQGSPMWHRSQL